MGGINASLDEIVRIKSVVEDTKYNINRVVNRMTEKLQYAKNNWDDKNYRSLEDILKDCVTDLQQIYKIISDTGSYLDSIYSIINEYENINIGKIDHSSGIYQDTLEAKEIARIKAEKTINFQEEISKIEALLSSFQEALEQRGVTDSNVISAILSKYRIIYQSDLLNRMNGETYTHRARPNFDQIAANALASGVTGVNAADIPNALSQTRYGFQEITFKGHKMTVYDDPIGTNSQLIQQQGRSYYDMDGTCGLCQCANLLTMAGILMTENEIISRAMLGSTEMVYIMDLFSADRGDRGATSANIRQEFLERQGLPITNIPISTDSSRTMRQLANAVATGHGVIVSVEVSRFWGTSQIGGHAISLLSVTSDGSTFIYNDTGRGVMGTISAQHLYESLTGAPANVTTNIIR